MRLFFALWLFVFGGFIVDAEASTVVWACPEYSDLAKACTNEAVTDLKEVGCDVGSEPTRTRSDSSETELYILESSNCTNELESGCPKGYELKRMETWTDSFSSFDQVHNWEMIRVRAVCKQQTGAPIS